MTTSRQYRLFLHAALLSAVLCITPLRSADAQTPAPVQTLLDKAHTLELQGRLDLATLTWQQVLLLDPANPEATAGLARADGTPRAASVAGPQTQRARLDEASTLATAGQYMQAMSLYRAVFGPAPPPGDYAVPFYETEAATEGGLTHAILGLRALVRKSPSDSRYQIALARILTYSPQTRPEGRRLLSRFPNDARVVEALRQSLLWDAQNPASAADVRSYLALHPDPQLAQTLQVQVPAVFKSAQSKAAPSSTSSSDEQAAFHDLHTGRIGEAEFRFKAMLERRPSSGPALAGMGYIRMQQGNFGGAISFLNQARQEGIEEPSLETALDTSRFWYTMGEGQSALAENDLGVAEKEFQTALAMRPTSPDALDGLGSALLKDFLAAAPVAFTGHYLTSFHYRVSAAGGVQTYEERAAPFYALDPTLQVAAQAACVPVTLACASYSFHAGTSAQYAVDATSAYRIADHWYFGAFLSANNTNLYNQVSTGFFLRYLFTPQIPLEGTPTGLFPIEGFLPLRVP